MPKSMPNMAFVKPKELNGWLKYTKAEEPKVAVFASGGVLVNAMDAVRKNDLYKKVDVFNANTIKPLDKKVIKEVAEKYEKILTLEDNVLIGGFGSGVLEALCEIDYDTKNFKSFGYPDRYINHGRIESLHTIAGIDTESIAETLLRMV
jgi:1-deoxy-D-xylulose-5-phosphate synthase